MSLLGKLSELFSTPQKPIHDACNTCELLTHRNRLLEKELRDTQKAALKANEAMTIAQHAMDSASILEEQNQKIGDREGLLLNVARTARRLEVLEAANDRAGVVLAMSTLRVDLDKAADVLRAAEGERQ